MSKSILCFALVVRLFPLSIVVFFNMESSDQALDALISMAYSLSCGDHVLELDLSSYVEPSITAKKLPLKILGMRKYSP